MGLGLYIAHALVELHGGQIWCESAPNQGTTFHITFPIVEGADEFSTTNSRLSNA